jgi:HSP20 family molecular chaperone IbpA
VEVTLEKSVLTIVAYPPVEQVEKYSLSYAEYGVGDYERKFVLSEDVDRERIEARVKNGVLYLRLPKAGPAKARKISVRAM